MYILHLELLHIPPITFIFLFQIFSSSSDSCRSLQLPLLATMVLILKSILSGLKSSCWELLVSVSSRSVIFTVILLVSKGTRHLRGGNIVCHILSEIYCCGFLLVGDTSFRHVITSLICGATGTRLSLNTLRPSDLQSGAVWAGWTFPYF